MDIKSLEKLPTKRLLAFYKAERKRQQSLSFSLASFYNKDENYYAIDLSEVKKLLDNREHLEKNKN